MKDIKCEYKKRKGSIRKRIREFEALGKSSDEDIFSELCFCILTPQSNAFNCHRAVVELRKSKLLLSGSVKEIGRRLVGVRFHNNKARYLVEARRVFKNCNGIDIKNRIKGKDVFVIREWLVKNVKGLGYKEASHFLRNIGYGKDLAILDRHILKNMKRYGIIKEIPKTLSRNRYMDLENKIRRFSKRINISLEDMDLLFWARETGVVFK